MNDLQHFTSLHFNNFKGFKDYRVSLRHFNILVGPNNSGKSTILGAFRILEEGMRKARAKKPEMVPGPERQGWGYSIPLTEIPIATENIFFDYDDSEPAYIKFRTSNGNELLLFFPKEGVCNLICNSDNTIIRSPSQFRNEFNAPIGFVPILGPVEHNEQLYQKEAARQALLTHRASRNFRNIWYHYCDDFDEFRNLIFTTWPGMDIEKPEIDTTHEKTLLHMFCPEERIPREIFWAGFGFQVWCQMLTYIVRGKQSSLFIIDEPDIYLHSDLQRQLLGILKTLGPDILIATHSTEIIAEADPDDLIIINRKLKSAKRIKNPSELQRIFNILGSNLNPTLTQLAKTRHALFVEGKDFQILSRFARKLKKNQVANRFDFAVIPVEGFNPQKVRDFIKGIEITLGEKIVSGVIFDRDFRSDSEVQSILKELKKSNKFSIIHNRKEIENFLLDPHALEQAIKKRIKEHNKRSNDSIAFNEDVFNLLIKLTDPLRHKIEAQYLSKRRHFEKTSHAGFDNSTIDEKIIFEFDLMWQKFEKRLLLIPGKDVLSILNRYLQENYKITLSTTGIIDAFKPVDIPEEMVKLINGIDEFRKEQV